MTWIKKVPRPHICQPPVGDLGDAWEGSIWECDGCEKYWVLRFTDRKPYWSEYFVADPDWPTPPPPPRKPRMGQGPK